MVHVLFDPLMGAYDTNVFSAQEGSGIASEGLDAVTNGSRGPPLTYPFFKGAHPYQRGWGSQRGAGVTDILRGVWRFFQPLLRRVGKTVSAEALNTGQRVFDKVVSEGAPLRETLISEGKRGIDTVLQQGGLPKQFGTGKRIKGGAKRRARSTPWHHKYIGRRVVLPNRPRKSVQRRNYKRSDTFGLF